MMSKDFMPKQAQKVTRKATAASTQTTSETAQPVQSVQRALNNPSAATTETDTVRAMQHTHGNQFVSSLVGQSSQKSVVQAKLTVTPADDVYEKEADKTAESVVQAINTPQSVQREEMPEEEEMLSMKRIQREEMPEEEMLQAQRIQREEMPEEEMLQAQRIQREEMPEEEMLQAQRIQREEMPEEEEMLSMKRIQRMEDPMGGLAVNDSIESQIDRKRGSGAAIQDSVRKPIEASMGADFSDVRVHTDSESDDLNNAVQAKAFTTGKDIFFKGGEYNPSDTSGQTLLAHELTHVVQQNNDVRRKPEDANE